MYEVRLTDRAETDIARVLAWFREQDAPQAGTRWLQQLLKKIATLENLPEPCGRAAESRELGVDLRELLFGRRAGRYRILFILRPRQVIILRLWHSLRSAISADELDDS